MKKNLISLSTALLLALLSFSGCQKEIENPAITPTAESEAWSRSDKSGDKNKCRLTYAVDWNSNSNWFFYNNKGLVNEWHIDFGAGIPDIYTMSYDNNNRLSNAQWHFDGALVGTIQFVWIGKYITTEHWDLDGFLFDVTNTYDQKGQIIVRETSYGLRAEIGYSPNGNPVTNYQYLEDELIGSDILSYTQPNRNPFRALPGIPYGFPYGNYVFGKFHESGDTYTVYENGNPMVVLDTDPEQTVMHMTHQNYLSSVTFFDKVSGSNMTRNFEYQNCKPGDNASESTTKSPTATTLSAGKRSSKLALLLLSTPDKVRKQIEKMRKQVVEMNRNK